MDVVLVEYVVFKLLMLNFKDMFVGDDFKKDIVLRGIVVVYIDWVRGFKEGDSGLGFIKFGFSDLYVLVFWGKFGKLVGLM